jgi:hypothetical protein
MFAGIRRAWHCLYTSVLAIGSSTAQRTRLGGGDVSRSETRKGRSMCVIWRLSMRCWTSGFRPDDGQTQVTFASALRQFRIRPAET